MKTCVILQTSTSLLSKCDEESVDVGGGEPTFDQLHCEFPENLVGERLAAADVEAAEISRNLRKFEERIVGHAAESAEIGDFELVAEPDHILDAIIGQVAAVGNTEAGHAGEVRRHGSHVNVENLVTLRDVQLPQVKTLRHECGKSISLHPAASAHVEGL
mmetsp:Transcript_14674/g.33692  ORF Transcript_14674/g.33692 Transcript_14674/m.33692 type:complete len:160 (+) Transcript_14674:1084-1563(+)